MAANKWMSKLQKLDGAVTREYNPFLHTIKFPSPSTGWVFGKTHGLPFGYSMVLYGPPKGGKSLLCNMMIGQLHRDDPDAIAIKYNTEMRELGQLTDRQCAVWGIDKERYIAYDTNVPNEIFDKIETDIDAMCSEGAKVKLIIIDSITGIRGRRAINADTVDTQQRGDDALTQQEGLKRILRTIRRYNIALVLTSHVRAEQDPHEQMRGVTTKMAGAWFLKHFAEYFVLIEPNKSKTGRETITGTKLEDENFKDLMDHGDRTGHKIRVTMVDSSVGPKGRVGEFTLDYNRGIINTAEEVFLLGTKRGIVDRPNNTSYVMTDFPAKGESSKWVGKEAFLEAIKTNDDLYSEVIKRVRIQDSGDFVYDGGSVAPEAGDLDGK